MIELTGLTKRYGSFTAVDSLTLSAERGEVLGLLGPNGSGKTTTLSMICGLVRPTAGSVTVKGLDPIRNAQAVRSLLGVVPQETALYEDLNAYENLRYQFALYSRSLTGMQQAINGVLDLMQLTDRAKDRVGAYSGGMKRRLALGRALLHDPEILFLDEPTLGVDVQSCHVLWGHVRDLRARGKTVLVTTNVMAEADYLCDRVAIIDRGRLIALDTPARLKASIGRDRVVLDVDRTLRPEDATRLQQLDPALTVSAEAGQVIIQVPQAAERLQGIIEALSGRYAIHRVEMQTPTLDDVFLSYTGRKLRD